MEEGTKAIGIDLGTTHSCVAVWTHGLVKIIPNADGKLTTPSWVAFTPSQRLIIGNAAQNQVATNPTNTIYGSKRLIGRRFSDQIVQNDIKLWPFTVLSGKDDKPAITVSYKGEVKHFVPEQISAMILGKMKETAEAYLGMKVKNAVVTVPAYFNNAQRQATVDAGTIAGLNVMRIINEPTAAAIAYGYPETASNRKVEKGDILVFDLGGGTLDVSLVNVAKDKFSVKATFGNTHLGGVDFDNNVVTHFVNEFKKRHSKDISGNPRALERLRVVCEKAKISLSLNTETPIKIDCLYEGIEFNSTLSRDEFERLNMDLFNKCIDVIRRCLCKAKIGKHEVKDIVLVGGSTRIPKIQQMLRKYFGGNDLCQSLSADEAVVRGAAIQAAFLSDMWYNQHFLVSEVTPLSLLGKNEYKNQCFRIDSNRQIPLQWKHEYVTTQHYEQVYQPTMPLRVSEVENNDYLLGTFTIGKGEICDSSVTAAFEIDLNNIFSVKLVRQIFGWSTALTIEEQNGKLSKDEIKWMTEDVKKYKVEDVEYIKMEKAKFEVEKFLNNMSDSLSSFGKTKPESKKKLKDVIQQTNRWLDLNSQLTDAGKYEDTLNELKDFMDKSSVKGKSSDLATPTTDPSTSLNAVYKEYELVSPYL